MCAKGWSVSRLFYFLEDRKVFHYPVYLSTHNSMSVMWHTPRFNRQSPCVPRSIKVGVKICERSVSHAPTLPRRSPLSKDEALTPTPPSIPGYTLNPR